MLFFGVFFVGFCCCCSCCCVCLFFLVCFVVVGLFLLFVVFCLFFVIRPDITIMADRAIKQISFPFLGDGLSLSLWE